jgi:hypothetical protein
MVRDFGPGMTADELIGMPAWHISRLTLPPGDAFALAQGAAHTLVREDGGSYLLEELWADGHSVWRDPETRVPAVVKPSGQIILGFE